PAGVGEVRDPDVQRDDGVCRIEIANGIAAGAALRRPGPSRDGEDGEDAQRGPESNAVVHEPSSFASGLPTNQRMRVPDAVVKSIRVGRAASSARARSERERTVPRCFGAGRTALCATAAGGVTGTSEWEEGAAGPTADGGGSAGRRVKR